ncbi:Dps family protein [Paenibacillus sp. 481]|uniref:Dps family protein n=1 Tax=Paenibacillus sp. 481 TaxID=2835869 RepID=UPI001E3CD2F3|nr:Dps family protein [Paenibacillus sp. 481]UHA72404.1 DNA starvation/stationary phase protection protein [Paenibacillus sp. 481]
MTQNQQQTQTNLLQAINQQVANLNVLYVKLHNYHWFVKGGQFFELHEKFEEYYTEVTANMDEVAERLLMIGGKPYASLKQYLEHASINEANGAENADQMVQQLVADFEQLIKEFKAIMELAEEAEDEATGDLFLGLKSGLEKHVWMLKSYIG